jgi:hypothetical protein
MLSSGLPFPDPFNLNESSPPEDGDGLYRGLAPLGSAVEATPAGTLITTFQFTALQETASTAIGILESGGDPLGETVVFSGVIPNLDVTGALSGADVTIGPPCPGDIDRNCFVDVDDLTAVILGWGPCDPPPAECPADIDGSGTVDVDDLTQVILGWGACP